MGYVEGLAIKRWKTAYIGRNEWELVPQSPYEGYILMTGANVITLMELPFQFRLKLIEWKHTDSAKADSTDALDYDLKKSTPEGLFLSMVKDNTNAKDVRLRFEENENEFNNITLQFNFNSTNTDRIYPRITIKKG